MENEIILGYDSGIITSMKVDKVKFLHPLLRSIYDRGGTMEVTCPKCSSKEIAFQTKMDVMLLPMKATARFEGNPDLDRDEIIYSIKAEDTSRKWGYLKDIHAICTKCNHSWEIKKF